ncbi:hypothetical protein HaLaN_13916, partial [Haematococcus lacustris]
MHAMYGTPARYALRGAWCPAGRSRACDGDWAKAINSQCYGGMTRDMRKTASSVPFVRQSRMKSGYNSRDPASYHVELGLCLEVCRQVPEAKHVSVRASPRMLFNVHSSLNAAASEAASLGAAGETASQGAAVGADDCSTARNKLASMYVLSSSTSLETPGQLAAAELQPLLRISSAVSNTTWPGRTLHGATPHVPCVTSAGSHLMPQVLCTSLAPEKSDPGHRSRGRRGGGREALGLEKSDPGQK